MLQPEQAAQMTLFTPFFDYTLANKKKKTPNKNRVETATHVTAERCVLDSSPAKRPACVQIKGHSWQQFGPVPWLHYQHLHWSLLGIPAERRRRTSNRPAKGAHLSERHGDHRPTNLPCLPDCRALRLRIKDKRAEPGSRRAEQPFYLEMVCRLNPPSMPFEDAY